MRPTYRIGELVHIPQATRLMECNLDDSAQLLIPLRVSTTSRPEVGIVTTTSLSGLYVGVFCAGDVWTVSNSNIYKLEGTVS